MTDPRSTHIHRAAQALDKLARITGRRDAAKLAAATRIDAKYAAQMDTVLEALDPEALALVKRQVGADE